MLDLKKNGLLTPSDPASIGASTRWITAAPTRFHRMRDSNKEMSDSMFSSLWLQAGCSPGSPSRQLSIVSPMIPPTLASTSSLPGKPLSPHTPHTPAVPSRLSAPSNIGYSHQDPGAQRRRLSNSSGESIFPSHLLLKDLPAAASNSKSWGQEDVSESAIDGDHGDHGGDYLDYLGNPVSISASQAEAESASGQWQQEAATRHAAKNLPQKERASFVPEKLDCDVCGYLVTITRRRDWQYVSPSRVNRSLLIADICWQAPSDPGHWAIYMS